MSAQRLGALAARCPACDAAPGAACSGSVASWHASRELAVVDMERALGMRAVDDALDELRELLATPLPTR